MRITKRSPDRLQIHLKAEYMVNGTFDLTEALSVLCLIGCVPENQKTTD